MNSLIPDVDEEGRAELEAAGFFWVTNSWGQSIWNHVAREGNWSASEALTAVEEGVTADG